MHQYDDHSIVPINFMKNREVKVLPIRTWLDEVSSLILEGIPLILGIVVVWWFVCLLAKVI